MKENITDHYNEIVQNVITAAEKAGRNPAEVKLIAVSKNFPNESIEKLYDYGQRSFGENKIQELEQKLPQLPDDIEWHFIGHLQGNKAVKAIELATYIHSVDSLRLLRRIEMLAGELGKKVNILLELNISGEETKFGTAPEAAMEIAAEAVTCKNVNFCGLMTMAPWGASEEKLHEVFGGLRKLRDKMEAAYNVKLPELSMGMSDDYKIAIEEGATMVRVGTAIFGKRSYL